MVNRGLHPLLVSALSVCLASCGGGGHAPDPVSANPFVATGSMTIPRQGHTATLLATGKVLIAGGHTSFAGISDAELYDPATGTCSATGNMAQAQTGHSALLLSDGKVLIGGMDGSFERYDPDTGLFSLLGATGGVVTGLAPLPGGTVLVLRGFSCSFGVLDPTTGTYISTGPMLALRSNGHATIPLADGRVLVVGGYFDTTLPPTGYVARTTLNSAECFDPVAVAFRATPGMAQARASCQATRLANGRVLVTGGSDENPSYTDPNPYLSSAELFDPATGSFSPTGSMGTRRAGHMIANLLGGRVLVLAGEFTPAPNSAELYDPAIGHFSGIGSTSTPRLGAAATTLADGRVLISGGGTSDRSTASCVLYP